MKKTYYLFMIVRWYMALSEFSFTLEFIPGIDNDIADSLSRLCRNNMIDSPEEYSPEYILSALHNVSHTIFTVVN